MAHGNDQQCSTCGVYYAHLTSIHICGVVEVRPGVFEMRKDLIEKREADAKKAWWEHSPALRVKHLEQKLRKKKAEIRRLHKSRDYWQERAEERHEFEPALSKEQIADRMRKA